MAIDRATVLLRMVLKGGCSTALPMFSTHIHLISALRRRRRAVIVASLCIFFGVCVSFSTVAKYKRSKFRVDYGGTSGDCPLKWENEKLKLSYYEAPRLDLSDIHKEDFLSVPKPVKHIYRNPVIYLNPDKFLLPVLENGPNNQLIGLRSTAFVAIKLNRTLVIPKFHKHFSDSQKSTSFFIYPGHRVDTEDLCNFISCITMDQFQRTCGRKVDAIFNLHNYRLENIRKMERRIGMQVLKESPKSDNQLKDLPLIPPGPVKAAKTFRQFKADEIKPLFESDARCVIYPDPLYNLKVSLGNTRDESSTETNLVESQADIDNHPASTLLLSIAHHSQSPKYIKKIAMDFMESAIGSRPYLGVHWRYNKEDFMNRCNFLQGANKVKKSLCVSAMSIKPVHIALAIEEKVLQLRELPEPVVIREVYIASPPSERELVLEVAAILHKRQGLKTLSSIELEDFMHKQFPSCEALMNHFNDIVSTTEMEICAHSYTFLGSIRSSWTANVDVVRRTLVSEKVRTNYDASIFYLSGEQLKKAD